jgi:hypothetical protein
MEFNLYGLFCVAQKKMGGKKTGSALKEPKLWSVEVNFTSSESSDA